MYTHKSKGGCSFLWVLGGLLIAFFSIVSSSLWAVEPAHYQYTQISFLSFLAKGKIQKLSSPTDMAAMPAPQAIEHGSRSLHEVALTFDADMTPSMLMLLKYGKITSLYNQKIKQILDKNDIPATIFLTGLWAKTYPLQSKELARDPLIELGNHSYNHYAFTPDCYGLPVVGNSGDDGEVEKAQKIISAVTGVTPKYFRFPGGCFDNYDISEVAKLGLQTVHWDVVADDGFNYNTQDIVSRVLTHVKNGSIIVMHIHGSIYAPKTADALLKIIPVLKKQHYTFVTITQLLDKNLAYTPPTSPNPGKGMSLFQFPYF